MTATGDVAATPTNNLAISGVDGIHRATFNIYGACHVTTFLAWYQQWPFSQ